MQLAVQIIATAIIIGFNFHRIERDISLAERVVGPRRPRIGLLIFFSGSKMRLPTHHVDRCEISTSFDAALFK